MSVLWARWRQIHDALAAHMVWLSLLGSILVVGLLYGQALGFSFLFDDTFDLPRVEGRSYLSLLTSSEGYSYYRPGPFLIWKLSHDVLGYYSAPLLHLLPLMFHALAGWLFYRLVSRLGAGQWAILPALLFLTYPFSYQNIAIAGVVFHPMAGAAIFASLNLYLSARHANGLRAVTLHCCALAATMVALWSHESGVAVAPLLLGLEALVLWRRGQRRPSWWAQGHVVAMLLFAATWLTVEKTPFGEAVTLGDMHPKALFFMQGLSYPLSAQIRWVEENIGWSPGIFQMTLLSFVVVFGSYLLAWRRSRDGSESVLSRLAFPLAGVVIAGVAALPSMARLSWPYVENAPRLLYLVGIGSALFWGLLPALDFGRKGVTIAWRVITTGLLIAVIVQSWIFIQLRMEMFASGSSAVAGIVEAGDRHSGRSLLVVNAPSWLALREYEYPYGHLGAQVMPDYIGLDRVIYTSSRLRTDVNAASASLVADIGGGRFTFGPHAPETNAADLDARLREGRVVVEVSRDGEGFVVTGIGQLTPGGAQDGPRFVDIPGVPVAVGLLRSVESKGQLIIYLSWNVTSRYTGGPSVTVELVDGEGTVVDRYDGPPLAGVSDPSLWQAGDRIDDRYRFVQPPDGRYTVRAGIEDDTVAIGEITVGR